jgi:hypothetical protein
MKLSGTSSIAFAWLPEGDAVAALSCAVPVFAARSIQVIIVRAINMCGLIELTFMTYLGGDFRFRNWMGIPRCVPLDFRGDKVSSVLSPFDFTAFFTDGVK